MHTQSPAIIHRDLKPANLLISSSGTLKICDFGQSLKLDTKLPSPESPAPVTTLHYRSPEAIFGDYLQTKAGDMWAIGCIFAELLDGRVLFDGSTEDQQAMLMYTVLGPPSSQRWPGYERLPLSRQFDETWKYVLKQDHAYLEALALRERFKSPIQCDDRLSSLGIDLLTQLLSYDPRTRVSAQDALLHPWFREYPQVCGLGDDIMRPGYYVPQSPSSPLSE